MLALCQHNTLAYYAFYYAGIFDAGLSMVVLYNVGINKVWGFLPKNST